MKRVNKPCPGWENEYGLKHIRQWVDDVTEAINTSAEEVERIDSFERTNYNYFERKIGELADRIGALEPKPDLGTGGNEKGEPITANTIDPDDPAITQGEWADELNEPITGHWECDNCGKDWGDGRKLFSGNCRKAVHPNARWIRGTWICFDPENENEGGCHTKSVTWHECPQSVDIDDTQELKPDAEFAKGTPGYGTHNRSAPHHKVCPHCKEQLRETQSKLQKSYDTQWRLQQEKEQQAAEISNLKTENERLRQMYKDAISHKFEAEADLAAAQRDNDRLKASVAGRDKMIRSWKNMYGDLPAMEARHDKDCATIRWQGGEINTLKSDLAAAQDEIDRLKNQDKEQ